MNVPGGFTTGFSFFYAGAVAGTITVYSGPNATGSVLATIPVPPNNAGILPCAAAPPAFYCNFTPIGVAFAGTAQSVDFGGHRELHRIRQHHDQFGDPGRRRAARAGAAGPGDRSSGTAVPDVAGRNRRRLRGSGARCSLVAGAGLRLRAGRGTERQRTKRQRKRPASCGAFFYCGALRPGDFWIGRLQQPVAGDPTTETCRPEMP